MAMFAFITKEDYWRWLDLGLADPANPSLKGIQDGFARSLLGQPRGLKIAEVGGGDSRVLKALAGDNECWNLDKFEGQGRGPTSIPFLKKIKVVPVYLGEFSPALPDNFFDVVFSISVLEHIPKAKLPDCFRDMARILKPGGLCFHAIDLYLTAKPEERVTHALNAYRDAAAQPECSLTLVEPALAEPPVVFDPAFATNPDIILWQRNRIAPNLRDLRLRSQSVSLKTAWRKMSA
jgi:SAM-dependent methyltransferase